MRDKIGDILYFPEFDKLVVVVGWADWLNKNVVDTSDDSDFWLIFDTDYYCEKIGEL